MLNLKYRSILKRSIGLLVLVTLFSYSNPCYAESENTKTDHQKIIMVPKNKFVGDFYKYDNGDKNKLKIINEIITSLDPKSNKIEIKAVRISKLDSYIIKIRYQIDWLRFSKNYNLGKISNFYSIETKENLNNKISDNIAYDKIKNPIISKSDVKDILNNCSGKLRLENNLDKYTSDISNIHWQKDNNLLLLEVNGMVDSKQGICAKSVIDLRSGDAVCKKFTCN